MIASLGGVVQAVGADHLVIDVRGVGYLVQASTRTLARMAVGEAAFVHVETQVREESITLFGFAHPGEREWFRHLTSVQGVGGRVALAILSTLSPEELATAISREDKAMISRANGVGPRLAARIVTELKALGAVLVASPVASAPVGSVARDAASALENLGFRPADAARAVSLAIAELGDDAPVNDLIRAGLRLATR